VAVGDLVGPESISMALAVLSLSYTVWVDRFKYQGRPAVYVQYSPEGAELTIVNCNEFPVQVVSVTRRKARGLGRMSESLPTFGRNPPFVLNPGERTVTGVPYSPERKRSQTIQIHVRSGSVSSFGRPKSCIVELRVSNVLESAIGGTGGRYTLSSRGTSSNHDMRPTLARDSGGPHSEVPPSSQPSLRVQTFGIPQVGKTDDSRQVD
jgi:hypothetical protein